MSLGANQVVGYTVNKFLPDNAIVASDCGTVTTWAARYLKMRDGMMFSALSCSAGMQSAIACDAAWHIASLIVRAWQSSAPRNTPGNGRRRGRS